MKADEREHDERRRHVRHPSGTPAAGAVGVVSLDGVVVDARDVGVGGVFVSIDPPPALHREVVVSFQGFRLTGRVVRVQRGGRDRGARVSPGVAVAFSGVDEDTLAALSRLLA